MNKDKDQIRCIGCGAILQDQVKGDPGYLPSSMLQKIEIENIEDGDHLFYCQRCFRLRNYNEINPVQIDNQEFMDMFEQIKSHDALIVNVIDLFDFNGSFIPNLNDYLGKNDLIVVGNKLDIFPHQSNQTKIRTWVKQRFNEKGIYPKEIILLSAAKSFQVKDLIAKLNQHQKGRDVYFVGTTNVGKSTLINHIIQELSDVKDLITTSRFPGTTLDQIKIPLEDGHEIIDTPGIINDNQLAHYLGPKSLNVISPKKELKPTVFQINPGQTLFLGGLGRIDYLEGPNKASFVVYADKSLVIHRTKTENADNFYEKHAGEILTPPYGDEKDLPTLQSSEVTTSAKIDIVFGGIAFVTVRDGIKINAYTPGAIGLDARDAII